MERMYRALLWLAGAGVAVDLIFLALRLTNAGQPCQAGFDQSCDSSPYTTLALFWLPTITSVAGYFNECAALTGAALAWADRRRWWFYALAVLAGADIVFPVALGFVMSRPEFYTVHPRVAAWVGNNALNLLNLASLAPSALALVFAWRGRAGDRIAARLEADAELEITRSSL
jgi:hypothetical protein